MVHRLLAFATLVIVGGCAPSSSGGEEAPEIFGVSRWAETWNPINDPRNADADFTYNIAQLPTVGVAASPPIPGEYWAAWKDSVNHRWAGPSSMSPAEKYGRAFGRPNLPDIVSSDYGIDHWVKQPVCRSDGDCYSSPGENIKCAIREGASSGRCIPDWWGICHGWSMYSISEPLATRPVVRNGVTFYPFDISALMSLVYGSIHTRYVSDRCEQTVLKADGDGRATDPNCRDMNPGAMHVVLANMLGLRRSAVVQDMFGNNQVWNHPIRAFQVVNAERSGGAPGLREVSRADAARLVSGGSDYKWSQAAARFFYVENTISYVVEAGPTRGGSMTPVDSATKQARYQYIVETDAQGNVIGGEWVGASRTAHPDFVWWPAEPPPLIVGTGGVIRYDEVQGLNAESAGVPLTARKVWTPLAYFYLGWR